MQPNPLPILVVDDYESMRSIMSAMLKALGYEDVDSAEDAVAALQMMHDKSYGLVISDVNMEPMSGLQLLRSVRSNMAWQGTRFLLTTASLNASLVTAAKNGGADAYLLKPFTPSQLKLKLHEILSRFHVFGNR
jgi:two-component system, chemotaxis family, chemotaxis protein CheY